MTLLISVWLIFGIGSWLDYMLRYNDMVNLLDFVILLPFMLLCGPLTTLRKLFP